MKYLNDNEGETKKTQKKIWLKIEHIKRTAFEIKLNK